MRTWKQFWVTVGIFSVGVLLVAMLANYVLIPWIVNDSDIITVPDLVGMPHTKATQKLLELSLVEIPPTYVFNAKVPNGRIISQQPYPGANVKEGRRVYLTISKGVQTVAMPKVTGHTIRETRLMLMRMGLQLGDITYTYHDSIPAQFVVDQSIAEGSQIPGGGTIDIVVSQGARGTRVPDVVGMTMEAAKDVIEQNGFILGKVTYAAQSAFDNNTVAQQIPEADGVLAAGSAINITVSKKE